jgi:TPR repeat protein
MKRLAAALGVAILASSCGRRGGSDHGQQPIPSASVISVAVEMGACHDLVACADECEAGSADRCRRIGVSYEFGKGVDADPLRATELYEKACAMSDSEGCISSGRMYEFHHGVAKDDAKAAGFYERACDFENPVGCANLAILLETGRGVERDAARAAVLFERACSRGSALACDHARRLRSPE